MNTARCLFIALLGGLAGAGLLAAPADSQHDEQAAVDAARTVEPELAVWRLRPAPSHPAMFVNERAFWVDFEPREAGPRLKEYQTDRCSSTNLDAPWGCNPGPLHTRWVVLPPPGFDDVCPYPIDRLAVTGLDSEEMLDVVAFLSAPAILEGQLLQRGCAHVCELESITALPDHRITISFGYGPSALLAELNRQCDGKECTYSVVQCYQITE